MRERENRLWLKKPIWAEFSGKLILRKILKESRIGVINLMEQEIAVLFRVCIRRADESRKLIFDKLYKLNQKMMGKNESEMPTKKM